MQHFNLYYRYIGQCMMHQKVGQAVLYVPAVNTIVEIQGNCFRVTSVLYMPEQFRFDIDMVQSH